MEAEREQAGRPFRERPGGRAFLSLPSKAVPKRRRTTGVPIAVVLRVPKASPSLVCPPALSLITPAIIRCWCFAKGIGSTLLDFLWHLLGSFLFWVLCSAAVVTISDWYQPPHLRSIPVEQELIRPPWHRQARRRSRWPSVSGRSTTRVRKAASCNYLFFFSSSRVLLFRFMMSTKSSILQYLTHPHTHIRSPSVFHTTQQKRSTGRSPSLRPRRGTRP